LEDILIESTKTAEYSYLNTYIELRSKRFIKVKQQSIMFNNQMCRLVLIKDVTRVLLSRNLQQ